MKTYHMELTQEDASTLMAVVNQGIDAHLQAVTASTFEWVDKGVLSGHRLVCDIVPNDLGVILRRLLESDDDVIETAESLAYGIASTLGIEEIWLCTDDRFYITLDEYYFQNSDQLESLATTLDLPYISVFDKNFWPILFEATL